MYRIKTNSDSSFPELPLFQTAFMLKLLSHMMTWRDQNEKHRAIVYSRVMITE